VGTATTDGFDGPLPHYDYGRTRLVALTPDQATERVHALALRGSGVGVHLCNAFTLSLTRHDPQYRDALAPPALNLVDGTPVTWFGALVSRHRVPSAVRGPSLMRALLDRQGLRHYLLGGTPDSLTRLREAIALHHPNAKVAGAWSPPFGPLTDDDRRFIIDDVKAADANIVWVGLGTPKQDLLIADMVEEVGMPMVAIGAAFDFVGGSKAEAPAWIQGTGFEWLFRLVSEPKRLWRRYLVGNAGFLAGAAREIAGSRRRLV
jgi:N-acetylglucosaminyldiphosphoundecaprenol N-acetyl-beta-D-mannosaminyltransferase